MSMTLQKIYQYPVKSLQGMAVNSATIQPEGLAHDRRWLITDPRGRFLTARRFPNMLLWQTHVDAHNNLTLTSPNAETLSVLTSQCTRTQSVQVWQDRFTAYVAPETVNHWLSAKLATPCQLIYLGKHSHRPLKDHTSQLTFADSSPYMLTTQASLQALNSQLTHPVCMNRFRPNFVVEGEMSAWAEDQWREIRIGEVVFEFYAYCTRCTMININLHSATSSVDNQPLKTLQRHHFSAKEPVFGIHLVAKNKGIVHLNDPIMIR